MARRYSQDQAYRLAQRHGATAAEARFLAAVMIPESGGNPRARNPTSGATGLWQIHPGGDQYYDPDKNVATALYKLRTQGKEAWEAYTRDLVGEFTPQESGGSLASRPQAESLGTGDSGGDGRKQVLAALISAAGERNPDYENVIAALGQLGATRRAPASPPEADPSSPATGGGATSGNLLEQLRQFHLADAITSGDRSVAANRATGGSPTSYHLPGGPDAYDLNPNDPDIPALVRYARRNPGSFKELYGPMNWHIENGRIRRGRYPGHDDHYHVAR